MQLVDKVMLCSEFMKDRLRLALPDTFHDKLGRMYHGIDHCRSKNEKKKEIIFAGRLIDEKGVLELVLACKEILPQYPDWTLRICGSERYGAQKDFQKLSVYAQETLRHLNDLKQQLVLTGFIPHNDLLNYMLDAEIVVVPSKWDEAFGRVALEALSQSCVLLTSGRGGLAEIAGDLGIVEETVHPQRMAKKLKDIMDDAEKRKRLQADGFERAQSFRYSEMLPAYDDVRGNLI